MSTKRRTRLRKNLVSTQVICAECGAFKGEYITATELEVSGGTRTIMQFCNMESCENREPEVHDTEWIPPPTQPWKRLPSA